MRSNSVKERRKLTEPLNDSLKKIKKKRNKIAKHLRITVPVVLNRNTIYEKEMKQYIN